MYYTTFANIPIGGRFVTVAYGATVFRKVSLREAEVVESCSPDYAEGQIRRMGWRLTVSEVEGHA